MKTQQSSYDFILVRDHLVGRWIRTHQHHYETDAKVCGFLIDFK